MTGSSAMAPLNALAAGPRAVAGAPRRRRGCGPTRPKAKNKKEDKRAEHPKLLGAHIACVRSTSCLRY